MLYFLDIDRIVNIIKNHQLYKRSNYELIEMVMIIYNF